MADKSYAFILEAFIPSLESELWNTDNDISSLLILTCSILIAWLFGHFLQFLRFPLA